MAIMKRNRKMAIVLAMLISIVFCLVYLAPADKHYFEHKDTNRENPLVLKQVVQEKADTKSDINKTRTKDNKQRFKMLHVQDTKVMVVKPESTKNRTSINEQTKNLLRAQDESKLENDPDLKHFLPRMSPNDRSLMLQTFDVFVQECQRTNLTYFLWAGSLLGAYRHHGFIPWDDDFDIVMDDSDREKIRDVLSSVQGYNLLAPFNRKTQWKFYISNLQPIPGKHFKWPFIDIFFFEKTSKRIVGISNPILSELKHVKEDIFPIQFRLLEDRYVAVPRKMEDVVVRQFGTDMCTSLSYLHKECKPIKAVTILCSRLHNFFPFVFREKYKSFEIILETLKRGNETLKTILVQ